jgi:hypothetical protein
LSIDIYTMSIIVWEIVSLKEQFSNSMLHEYQSKFLEKDLALLPPFPDDFQMLIFESEQMTIHERSLSKFTTRSRMLFLMYHQQPETIERKQLPHFEIRSSAVLDAMKIVKLTMEQDSIIFKMQFCKMVARAFFYRYCNCAKTPCKKQERNLTIIG